jgi:hypothetical protein
VVVTGMGFKIISKDTVFTQLVMLVTTRTNMASWRCGIEITLMGLAYLYLRRFDLNNMLSYNLQEFGR